MKKRSMNNKLKTLGRLYALYARMDIRWFLQDRLNCTIVLFSELLTTVASVSGVFLLAMRFEGVGFMTQWEVLWMLGFYTLSDGVLFMLFGGGNIHQISRRVGRGQVDHMLMQPIPLWMQCMADGFMPVTGITGLLAGLALTIYATPKAGISITPMWLAALVLLIGAKVAIEMGLSFLLASGAFYKPVACEEISSVGHDLLGTLGKYPLSGLNNVLVDVLCTVLPAGLMAWFPSLILLGKVSALPAILLPLTVAAIMLSLATFFFKKGLRHYAKFSCNRYRDMGHR